MKQRSACFHAVLLVHAGISAASSAASDKVSNARIAAFMGLRMMSEQAGQLAKQGSMIPHAYPERHLSSLPETPPPLGKTVSDTMR